MIEFTLPLQVAHIITADDPFGEPWPPDGSCSVVRRTTNGFTLWRCITLSGTRVHAPLPAARASSLGGNEDTMTKHQKTQQLRTEKEKMELKTENTTLPAVMSPETLAQLDADIAALAAEARELSDDTRIGDDLKFRKGKWSKTIGDDEIKVGGTTPFAFDMRSYRRGWIKWVDRKPVYKATGRPLDGFISPTRERLPDRDESQWPCRADESCASAWCSRPSRTTFFSSAICRPGTPTTLGTKATCWRASRPRRCG